MSLTGVATEEDQILVFKSRAPFTAKFTCDRERKDANCIPILPLRLYFNSPVSWETARKIRIKGPGAKIYKPSPDSGRYRDEDEGEEYGDNESVGEGPKVSIKRGSGLYS